MSGDSTALLAEIQLLRRDLAELTARVIALEAARFEPPQRLQASPGSPVTVNYTFPIASQSDPGPPALFGADQLPLPQLPTFSADEQGYSERYRSEVASGVGRFFARCLSGQHRGTSGREKVKLPSAVYILCRDHQGRCYNPVQVHHSFSSLRALVKPRGDCGSSVFAGFPSLWEARTAVRSAGLNWPTDDA